MVLGINVAIEKVTGFLDGLKREVTTDEDIMNVATISANGDKVVGKLITDAMNKVLQHYWYYCYTIILLTI